jgi:hypothetical protein
MIFLVTFFIYPLRANTPMLFATLRMIAMALLSVFLTVLYFRDVEDRLIRDGFRLGFLWLIVSIVLDQGPFVWGLMRLSFPAYLADYGLGYIIYPIITVGAGFLLSADKNIVEDSEASTPWPHGLQMARTEPGNTLPGIQAGDTRPML